MTTEIFNADKYTFQLDTEDGYVAGLKVIDGEISPDNLSPLGKKVRRHLNAYFKGAAPNMPLPIRICSGTEFQRKIWTLLRTIPYGETKNYSQLAVEYGDLKAIRAVGHAIGLNPITILVPCHRVLGKNGSLTGFAYGLPMKKHLLEVEDILRKEKTLFD